MKLKKLKTLNILGGGINNIAELSRSEMKKILAGSGCSTQNCFICAEGGWGCATTSEPKPPSCGWGICPECC